MGALILALVAYAALVEPQMVEVTRLEAYLPRLHPHLDGLVVMHLTDLHLVRVGRRERRVLKLASEVGPDAVVITGDICGPRWAKQGAQFLSSLRPPLGTYWVPGNNDGKSQHLERLQQMAPSARLLLNRHVLLRKGEGRLLLVGVDDPVRGSPDLLRALEGAPTDVPALLLAHSPEVIHLPGAERFDLILCGHTHGGQICPLPRRPLYAHLKRRAPASGLHPFGKGFVFVSRGLGTSVLPLRFLCPPEVALITLRHSRPQGVRKVEVVSRSYLGRRERGTPPPPH